MGSGITDGCRGRQHPVSGSIMEHVDSPDSSSKNDGLTMSCETEVEGVVVGGEEKEIEALKEQEDIEKQHHEEKGDSNPGLSSQSGMGVEGGCEANDDGDVKESEGVVKQHHEEKGDRSPDSSYKEDELAKNDDDDEIEQSGGIDGEEKEIEDVKENEDIVKQHDEEKGDRSWDSSCKDNELAQSDDEEMEQSAKVNGGAEEIQDVKEDEDVAKEQREEKDGKSPDLSCKENELTQSNDDDDEMEHSSEVDGEAKEIEDVKENEAAMKEHLKEHHEEKHDRQPDPFYNKDALTRNDDQEVEDSALVAGETGKPKTGENTLAGKIEGVKDGEAVEEEQCLEKKCNSFLDVCKQDGLNINDEKIAETAVVDKAENSEADGSLVAEEREVIKEKAVEEQCQEEELTKEGGETDTCRKDMDDGSQDVSVVTNVKGIDINQMTEENITDTECDLEGVFVKRTGAHGGDAEVGWVLNVNHESLKRKHEDECEETAHITKLMRKDESSVDHEVRESLEEAEIVLSEEAEQESTDFAAEETKNDPDVGKVGDEIQMMMDEEPVGDDSTDSGLLEAWTSEEDKNMDVMDENMEPQGGISSTDVHQISAEGGEAVVEGSEEESEEQMKIVGAEGGISSTDLNQTIVNHDQAVVKGSEEESGEQMELVGTEADDEFLALKVADENVVVGDHKDDPENIQTKNEESAGGSHIKFSPKSEKIVEKSNSEDGDLNYEIEELIGESEKVKPVADGTQERTEGVRIESVISEGQPDDASDDSSCVEILSVEDEDETYDRETKGTSGGNKICDLKGDQFQDQNQDREDIPLVQEGRNDELFASICEKCGIVCKSAEEERNHPCFKTLPPDNLTIGDESPAKNYKECVCLYKDCQMAFGTDEEVERHLVEFHNWEEVKGASSVSEGADVTVDKDALEVKSNVVTDDKDIVEVNSNVANVDRDILKVTANVAAADKDMLEVSSNVVTVNKDVLEVNSDVANVDKDILVMKSSVWTVEKDISEENSNITTVDKDILEVNSNVSLVCPVNGCSEKFSRIADVEEHQTKGHKEVACSYCSQFFTSFRMHIAHEATHNPNLANITFDKDTNRFKPGPVSALKCHICGLLQDSEQTLRHHTYVYHQKIAATSYICAWCTRAYNSKADVENHAVGVLNQLLNSCDVCRQWFYSLEETDKHMQKSHGSKEKFCKECCLWFCESSVYDLHCTILHKPKETVTSADDDKEDGSSGKHDMISSDGNKEDVVCSSDIKKQQMLSDGEKGDHEALDSRKEDEVSSDSKKDQIALDGKKEDHVVKHKNWQNYMMFSDIKKKDQVTLDGKKEGQMALHRKKEDQVALDRKKEKHVANGKKEKQVALDGKKKVTLALDGKKKVQVAIDGKKKVQGSSDQDEDAGSAGSTASLTDIVSFQKNKGRTEVCPHCDLLCVSDRVREAHGVTHLKWLKASEGFSVSAEGTCKITIVPKRACTKCGMVCRSHEVYANHMVSHKHWQTYVRKFTCMWCRKMFNSRRALFSHVTEVLIRFIDSCTVCHVKDNTLEQADKNHLKCKPTREVCCEKCNIYLTDAECLKTHQEYTHTPARQRNDQIEANMLRIRKLHMMRENSEESSSKASPSASALQVVKKMTKRFLL